MIIYFLIIIKKIYNLFHPNNPFLELHSLNLGGTDVSSQPAFIIIKLIPEFFNFFMEKSIDF